MLNNLKFFVMLVLLIGVVGSAAYVSAQTGGNKVLVSASGKTLRQSDVNKMIEFYEWAFQTEFNGEQRSEFVKIKAEQFRNDPVEAEKGNSAVSGFLPKIAGRSESEREKVRQAFNESFIPDLRKGAGDSEAQLLIGIYDSTRGMRDGAAANNQTENSEDRFSGGGNFGSFAGKWVWQNSGSGHWENGTGAYLGGSGSRVTYQFSANGDVQYSGIINSMMGGCSQQVFLSQKGRATLSGSTMTIKWAPGTSTRDYSCDKAGNYTKTAPAVTETFPVSFKTNSTGQKLLCMNSGSKETCYSPAK